MKVRQSDLAGNVSDERAVTVRAEIPTPTIRLAADTGTSGDFITSNGAVIVENIQSGATWQYSLNGGGQWGQWQNGSGSQFTITEQGAHRISVRQGDGSGNFSVEAKLGNKPLPPPVLSGLDGSTGLRLIGTNSADASGYSVNSAGDFDGDGFNDLIIGSLNHVSGGTSTSGPTYVIYGKASGFGSSMVLSDLDGTNGFRIQSASTDYQAGSSVSSVDINGDGLDDLIIGTPYAGFTAEGRAPGAVYVIFGSSARDLGSIDLSALDGNNGFRLNGTTQGDYVGTSVSSAGDVDGDGIDDLIIGASGADNGASASGSAYVIFGSRTGFGSTGFGSSINLSDLGASNAPRGFRLDGAANDRVGSLVSGGSDLNGDHLDDLIIKAGIERGSVYIVYGGAANLEGSIDLSTLSGTAGMRIEGPNKDSHLGISINATGDINGDGYPDLVLGGWADDQGVSTYVIFGSASGLASSINLSSLDGNNGFSLAGLSVLHSSLSTGDINGDGVDDLIIGSNWYPLATDSTDYEISGSTYVVFGKRASFNSTLNVSDLDGSNGFYLQGEHVDDHFGQSVSAAGDINHDGFDDLVIGAHGRDTNGSNTGTTYIVFGQNFSGLVTLDSVKPDAPALALNTDTGSSDGITSDGTIKVTGLENGAAWEYRVGSTGTWTTGSGNSFDLSGGADGPYSVYVRQTDVAGNQSLVPATGFAFTLDKTVAAPTLSLATDTGTSSSDRITSDGTINVNGLESGAAWQYRLGSGGAWTNGSGSSFDLSGAADGPYSVYVRQTDGAGNQSLVPATGFAFTLDKTVAAPTLSLATDTGTSSSDRITSDGTINVNGLESGAAWQYRLGSGGAWTNGSGSSFDLSGAADGPYSVYVRQTDGAGNQSLVPETGFAFTLDKSAPSAPTIALINDTGTINSDGITSDGTITVSGLESSANWEYRVGSGGSWTTGSGSSFDLTSQNDGPNSVYVRQTDVAGNQSVVSETGFTFTLDKTVAAPTPNLANDTGTPDDFITSDGTINVTGLESGATWEYKLDSNNWLTGTGSSVDLSSEALEAHTVLVRQTDKAGNTSASSTPFTFTLVAASGGGSGGGSSSTAAPALSALNGSNGFRLDGTSDLDFSGAAVSNAGDVNGDGFDDLLIGAPGFNNAAGAAFIVFGKASGFASTINLSTLNGSDGFRLNGASASDGAGFSVSSAGDINNDGYADIMVGVPGPSHYGSTPGTVYVIYGKSSSFNASIVLSTLNGSDGFRLEGPADEGVGLSVGSVDINGDGYSDLLIGSESAGPIVPFSGATYVVFGQSAGFATSVSLSSLDGINGFRLEGSNAYDGLGNSVSSAGDINGDGYEDLLIGASAYSGSAFNAGATYVLYGKSAGFGTSIDASSLTGSVGFRIVGDVAYGDSGRSVSRAGDINGDGIDDLIIGAPGESYTAGASYVLFGSTSGFADTVNLSDLNGSTGFRLEGNGVYGTAGISVNRAGDVNGDGYDDLIVGAPGVSDNAGAAYVIYGKSSFSANIALSSLDSSTGFRLDGVNTYDEAGFSVSAAGDVNGDGFDDLIVGAKSSANNGVQSGSSYIIFGADFGQSGTGSGGGTPTTPTLALVSDSGTLTDDGITKNGSITVGELASNATWQYNLGTGASWVTGSGSALELSTDNAYTVRVRQTVNGTDSAEVTLSFTLDQSADAPTLSLANDTDTAADFITSDGTINVTGLESGATWEYKLDSNDWAAGTGSSVDLSSEALEAHTVLVRQTDKAGNTSASSTPFTFTLVAASGGGSGGGSSSTAAPALSALNGSNGFRLDGTSDLDFSGAAVSNAGDVNGDGFDDLLIGAPGFNNAAGAAFIVFGKASGFASTINLSTLNGSDGFRLNGASASDGAGFSVSSAGDINNDGYADIMVGVPGPSHYGSTPGTVYVIYGKSSSFNASIVLSTLNGSDGFRLEGPADEGVGLSVGSVDINGDGYSDLLIGSESAGPIVPFSGATYVVFGQSAGFATSVSLSSLDGINGFRLEGSNAYDGLGNSVSSAGDINGDGYEDLLIGASAYSGSAFNAGATYVLYGKSAGFGTSIDASSLTGSVGFRIVGDVAYGDSGRSVSRAGDINGDGIDDLIIGAPGESYTAGASYVLFGSTSGFADTVNLSDLNGSTGFRLEGNGVYGTAGISVNRAGDVNGDGYDDLIVGAPGVSDNAGAAYVIYGKSSFSANIALSSLDSSTGFRLDGVNTYDEAGFSVSAAGDVNGDGFDDLIVGAKSSANNGVQSGTSYIVFGADFTSAVTHPGTASADTLTGTAGADVIIGGDGNDTITAGGGADIVKAGRGDDIIKVSDLSFHLIDGGNGSDTLELTGASMTLDFRNLAGTLRNIEVINLRGSGDNTLQLSKLDLLNLSSTSNFLRVDGDAGDTVDALGSGWVADGSSGGYDIYVNDNAILLIGFNLTVHTNVI